MSDKNLSSADIATLTLHNSLIALMRLVLAVSALLVILIDPSEPDRLVPVTYIALILYSVYSAIIFLLCKRSGRFASYVHYWTHWADIAWYLLFISLSSGTNSIFFYFFFFSILVGSFRWGFSTGFRLAMVSTILFSVIGYLTAPAAPAFELNRFLLRPLYLCVLGYMIAYWGGYEILLKRRLGLLRELTQVSNPRFGVLHTIGKLMERIRSFYDADSCVLILIDPETGRYILRHATRADPNAGIEAKRIDEVEARRMLAIPDHWMVAHGGRGMPLPMKKRAASYACDLLTGERILEPQDVIADLADMLDAASYMSIPLFIHSQFIGRFFVVFKRLRFFNHSDLDFLLQASEHVTPFIDNIRLVDRLASDAAEDERKKIAHDIHDSIIQPYIGIQIGIAAAYEGLVKGEDARSVEELEEVISRTRKRLERLSAITEDGVKELRGYVRGLSETELHESSLLISIHRFAVKFGEATGINVTVEAENVNMTDRLAAEVFHIVAEALSNVRRHTRSAWAAIRLTQYDNTLRLSVENDGSEVSAPATFTPRSIGMRVKALGGSVRVERPDSKTRVSVEIPL